MSRILQIQSSLSGDAGASSRLARRFVERYRALRPGTAVHYRDLATDAPRHLDAETFAAATTAPEARDDERHRLAEAADRSIEELRAADLLVVAAPMYNFGIPSTLKAWFDQVARAGVTFRYTERGPQGLLAGKRAVVLHTRGGTYAGSGADHLAPHVEQFLAFLGIDDVTTTFAEGLATADGEASLARAGDELDALAAAMAGAPVAPSRRCPEVA
jgi:FMN-dependent NADH-azoreductase